MCKVRLEPGCEGKAHQAVYKGTSTGAAEETERCPLRDFPVMDQKNKLGMVLSCFSTRCEMTPEGTCRILAGVLDHWKAAAGIQTVPPEKVENSNELS